MIRICRSDMQLRDYQQASIDAVALALAKSRTALIVAPTGSGKAVISAGIAARAIKAKPHSRVLCLCSTQEILKQNESTLNQLAPHIETGIYCAGAGRKESEAQVVFASRDSLGRDPLACGMFDGIVLDEAHQATVDLAKSNTMYARIINAQNFRWLVGLTGTPWRLGGGRIWGEGKFFETIAYNIPMRTLIDRGYLSTYVFPQCSTQIDTSNVKVTSAGDFHLGQLEGVTGEALCRSAVREWLDATNGRRVSLFFCVSRAHGKLLTKILSEHIGSENVCYIDGESRDRETLGNEIRAGKFKAIVNIGTLTTGFDAPIIDCVVFLRPTQSVSLFVQMAGRGLRRYEGKQNCLYLDMAGNFERFRSIETPQVNSSNVRENAAQEDDDDSEISAPRALLKDCPVCSYTINARATFCGYCGEVFVKANQKPFTGNQSRASWWYVVNIEQDEKISARGNDCKRIAYTLHNGSYYMRRTFYEYFVKRNPKAMSDYRKRLEMLSHNPKAIQAQVDGVLIKIFDVHY